MVGDAAYECTDWCLTPYPGRLGKGLTIEKDNYNFYQSQMRINIERTFGMLVKRFGILGRAQTSPLDHVSLAVAVFIKVHNECIKDSDFADDFDDSAMNTMDDHDQEEDGNTEVENTDHHDAGSRRDEVCNDIAAAGLSRPKNPKNK